MADYEHSTYGDRIAAVYDQFHSNSPVTRFTDATVEFLASIAGKRRVLELGIGTGRIRKFRGRENRWPVLTDLRRVQYFLRAAHAGGTGAVPAACCAAPHRRR